jgi:hypothetical protein
MPFAIKEFKYKPEEHKGTGRHRQDGRMNSVEDGRDGKILEEE